MVGRLTLKAGEVKKRVISWPFNLTWRSLSGSPVFLEKSTSASEKNSLAKELLGVSLKEIFSASGLLKAIS